MGIIIGIDVGISKPRSTSEKLSSIQKKHKDIYDKQNIISETTNQTNPKCTHDGLMMPLKMPNSACDGLAMQEKKHVCECDGRKIH